MKVALSKRYIFMAVALLIIASLFWVDAGQRLFKAGHLKAPNLTPEVMTNEGDDKDSWNLLFERRVPAREQFAVIADKNVFSPLRRAWAPPPPPPEPEPDVEREPEPEPQKPLPKRGDIELRGTAVMDKERMAILRFKNFRAGQTMFLAEGAIAQEEDVKDGPKFTITRIEAESVRLKDGSGQEFAVGLYDHVREAPRSVSSEVSVEVAPVAAPQGAAVTESGSSAVIVGEGSGGGSNGNSPETRMQRQQEKNEQLVKEGKMRKISTPFGPVYRKNE